MRERKYFRRTTVANTLPWFFVNQMAAKVLLWLIEPRHDKICHMPYANNTGADQTAHPRSLISTFIFAAEIV